MSDDMILITCDSEVCDYCARKINPQGADDKEMCDDCFNHNFFIGIECWREANYE